MGSGHHHNYLTNKERSLVYALILTASFFFVELVGGFLTASLALISDAAHMMTDVAALIIALVAIHIGKRPVDNVRTFGYYRFEILAAAFNTILLFLVAIYIVFEACQRLKHPPEVHSQGMLIIATFGLIVNFISMRLLMRGKEKSLNIKSAYLEVWSDMLGSAGVIVAALVIWVTSWVWVDSLIAILIAFWILPRAWILLKESVNILLEGVPKGIDLKTIQECILQVSGVRSIHELHVWGITNDRISLTAHVVTDKKNDCEKILLHVRELLASQFGIFHTTLQHESKACLDQEVLCNLTPHQH